MMDEWILINEQDVGQNSYLYEFQSIAFDIITVCIRAKDNQTAWNILKETVKPL